MGRAIDLTGAEIELTQLNEPIDDFFAKVRAAMERDAKCWVRMNVQVENGQLLACNVIEDRNYTLDAKSSRRNNT